MAIWSTKTRLHAYFGWRWYDPLLVPTRPGTRTFLQVPDPSRPKVKNLYPSDPDPNHHHHHQHQQHDDDGDQRVMMWGGQSSRYIGQSNHTRASQVHHVITLPAKHHDDYKGNMQTWKQQLIFSSTKMTSLSCKNTPKKPYDYHKGCKRNMQATNALK